MRETLTDLDQTQPIGGRRLKTIDHAIDFFRTYVTLPNTYPHSMLGLVSEDGKRRVVHRRTAKGIREKKRKT